MLRLIIGRSGSGKTEYIRRMLCSRAENGERVTLIVPEQYSFESERGLLEMLPPSLTPKIDVLSFSRLAERVIEECGGVYERRLTAAGKIMQMSIAVESVADRLELLKKNARSPGFLTAMLGLSTQLKRGGVSTDRLREVSGTLGRSLLQMKLREIALLLDAYDARLVNGRFDPADDLTAAAELLRGKRRFDGAVALDGFTDFTGQELNIIGELLQSGAECYVTVCADNLTAEENSLFAISKKTAAALMRTAADCGVSCAEPVYLYEAPRFKKTVLETLEQGFLNPAAEGDMCGEIGLCACRSVYDEGEFAARVIKGLVRDENYRFRDIAVVVRNDDGYRAAVSSAFSKYGIPCFIDRRLPAVGQPLMLMASAALELAVGGLKTESLIKYIKTGLCLSDISRAAELENYVYIWGIEGDDWLREFTRDPAGMGGHSLPQRLADIELSRKEVIAPVARFLERVKGTRSAEEISRALYLLLKEQGADKALGALRREALRRDVLQADAFSASWAMLMDILEQMALGGEDVAIDAGEYLKIFRLILQQSDLGALPPALDMVQFGGAERMRMSAPRAVIILGANFGVFPGEGDMGGLISRRDRTVLSDNGLELFGGRTDDELKERFLAYRAISAPSERLYVSWHTVNGDGSAAAESVIVSEIRRLCGSQTKRAEEISALEAAQALLPAVEYFAKTRSTVCGENAALREYLLNNEKTAGLCRAVCGEGEKPALSGETAVKLYGKNMRLSPTRLDTYRRCAFSYFCKYGLGVSARRRAGLDVVERGSMIHRVLELMLERYGGAGLRDIDDGRLFDESLKIMTDYLAEAMGDLPKDKRFLYVVENVAANVVPILRGIGEEFAQSRFEVAACEVDISDRDGAVPPVVLPLSDGGSVSVRGVVDRVDVMTLNGKKYARVVDYKSGSKRFDIYDLLSGFDMQMLIYLFTVIQNGGDRFGRLYPAGALYMPVGAPAAQKGRLPSGGDRAGVRKFSGMVLRDADVISGMESSGEGRIVPAKIKNGEVDGRSSAYGESAFCALERLIREMVTDMGEAMHAGKVDVDPTDSLEKNACAYCDFAAVCGNSDGSANKPIDMEKAKERLKLITGEGD